MVSLFVSNIAQAVLARIERLGVGKVLPELLGQVACAVDIKPVVLGMIAGLTNPSQIFGKIRRARTLIEPSLMNHVAMIQMGVLVTSKT